MRIFFRRLVLAIVLIALGAVLGPWLKNLGYAIRLAAMPAPTVLPVPVEGVKPSRLLDTWGGVRSEGRRHEGIDIFAKRGTPSHLHYGIYTTGGPIDPYPFLRPGKPR